jgi:hypothetical protein
MSTSYSIPDLEARIARCEAVIRKLTDMQAELRQMGSAATGRSHRLNESIVASVQRSLDYYRSALAMTSSRDSAGRIEKPGDAVPKA